MSITLEDIQVLEARFPVSEHKFNPRGFCYIKETSITRRLDQVDPAWSFVIVNIAHRGDTVTVTARLTVKGVVRENTGSQTIAYIKDSDKESGEPEKGATTDALRRCSRLFGIGRYILSFPDYVKDMNALAKFMNEGDLPQPKQQPQQLPAQEQPAPSRYSPPSPASDMAWYDNADMVKRVVSMLKENGVQAKTWGELRSRYPVKGYKTADEYIKAVLNTLAGNNTDAHTPCIVPSKAKKNKTKQGNDFFTYTDDNNVSVSVFKESDYTDINIMGIDSVMIFYTVNEKGYNEYVSHSVILS